MNTQEPSSAATSFAVRDPETFFKAQKRNRRATWRMSALGVLAAFIMGIPLTLVLTPLLYAVTLIVADTINYFSPLRPEFWQNVDGLAKLFVRVADYVFNQRGTLDPQELAIGLALTLLPGMLLAFLLWVGVQLLFRHGGVGGTLSSLNAREPNPNDLKELQLADVVPEMAIAAGLPAPKVMLIDSDGANAAAIGTSPQDARIVISRRLLDDLDRDQLQAVLAGQVASIGNGDLHIAFTVTSVFETCGLIVTLINSPFGSESRRTLWRIIRYAFSHSSEADRAAEAAEVAEMLSDTLDVNSSDIETFFNKPNAGIIRKFLRLIFFPIQFTNIAVEITLWFFLHLLLGPCMALLWRTRRYLADASAVELTRNPEAMAAALERLGQDSTAIVGGGWASHLFAMNPAGDRSLGSAQPSPEQIRQAALAWAESGGQAVGSSRLPPADFSALEKEVAMTAFAAARGDAQAVTRMQAFAQSIAAIPGLGPVGQMPNIADLLAAQRGDRAAIARLRATRQQRGPERQMRHGKSGLQTNSFVGFHPPLKKRLRRLELMGAAIRAQAHAHMGTGARIFTAVLWLILGPVLAVAGALMLVVILLMIGLNLLFLSLWLAVIHWAFGQNWTENFAAFMKFVDDVMRALNKARR
jgi:Zn-dependent protease with chaperone function